MEFENASQAGERAGFSSVHARTDTHTPHRRGRRHCLHASNILPLPIANIKVRMALKHYDENIARRYVYANVTVENHAYIIDTFLDFVRWFAG